MLLTALVITFGAPQRALLVGYFSVTGSASSGAPLASIKAKGTSIYSAGITGLANGTSYTVSVPACNAHSA